MENHPQTCIFAIKYMLFIHPNGKQNFSEKTITPFTKTSAEIVYNTNLLGRSTPERSYRNFLATKPLIVMGCYIQSARFKIRPILAVMFRYKSMIRTVPSEIFTKSYYHMNIHMSLFKQHSGNR